MPKKLKAYLYALATINKNLSQGEKEKIFRKASGETDPQRGRGSGYVEFAQFQANDPEAKRKVAFRHESKKEETEQAISIRNNLRSINSSNPYMDMSCSEIEFLHDIVSQSINKNCQFFLECERKYDVRWYNIEDKFLEIFDGTKNTITINE
jgi:hypothetical protein